MYRYEKRRIFSLFILCLTISLCAFGSGCQEFDTIKNEILKKATEKLVKNKHPFVQRDGITIRASSLFQAANPNSEIISKLPAETPIHLMDKVGEWYRVRTRDGREGFVESKVVGGEEMIQRTHELRRSIEGIPAQAEGTVKSKANFRLFPGRDYDIIETLPAGKKFEVYERVVTIQKSAGEKTTTRGRPQSLDEPSPYEEFTESQQKKDVWYKVKIEDGRVGYIFTSNMELTPPEDIARAVPFMRMVAWRTLNSTDDPDRGAKNNYIVAYAPPLGKDPGCDYVRLYYVSWNAKLKRRITPWDTRVKGVLPITNHVYEGKPGFSIRSLHPTRKDRLVLINFAFSKGTIRKVGEEEIPSSADLH